MTQYIFEFIGTLVLVLLGDGVCANVTLNKSKAQGAGWVVIALAWGFAVMCGVLIAGPVSGAHLNPAVTLGLAIAGKFAWEGVFGYIVAQMLGGFCGAVLVYVFFKDHYDATSLSSASGSTAAPTLSAAESGPSPSPASSWPSACPSAVLPDMP